MDFIAVLANNIRSKAYLQTLIKEKLFPKKVYVLENITKVDLGVIKNKKKNLKRKYSYKKSILDVTEVLVDTLSKFNIPYKVLNTQDINSDEVYNNMLKCNIKLVIVSVFAGQILKARILNAKKKFLHIHAGKLPYYRGSTTIYYSLLEANKVAATAIFLNEGIDTGDIICFKEYKLNFDPRLIDLVFDPLLRADVLVAAIKLLFNKQNFTKKQNISCGEDYFIIHPVLKHLAILKEENKC